MQTSTRRVTALVAATSIAIAIASFPPVSAMAGASGFTDWVSLSNARYGFEIAYPGSVFAESGERLEEEGLVLVSRDGKVKLVAATFANETGVTLDEYRRQLLDENYRGAEVDFAPEKSRWFILSGTQGDMHFYERVTFTCGGKWINSWALLYPVAEKRYWDRLVEAIAPTYSPGSGRTGACD